MTLKSLKDRHLEILFLNCEIDKNHKIICINCDGWDLKKCLILESNDSCQWNLIKQLDFGKCKYLKMLNLENVSGDPKIGIDS